jgi:hypothetical protein
MERRASRESRPGTQLRKAPGVDWVPRFVLSRFGYMHDDRKFDDSL